MNRREALEAMAAITLSGMSTEQSALAELASTGSQSTTHPTSNELIYRPLGRTGEKVSAIGHGGHHIGRLKDPAEGIRIIRSAIDRGITFHGQLLGLSRW